MIMDDLNTTMHNEQDKEFTYSEVYEILKIKLNLSWRKANFRTPKSLRRGLEG